MITLTDMVANGSVSPAGAEVLRGIGASGRSFLVYAGPRNAGKSTLVEAILAEVPANVRRQQFYGTPEETATLSAAAPEGYLQVGEIGHRGRPGYLAGEEAARLFELVSAGYALASSLHADSVAEVHDVLRANGATPAALAAIPYLIKVRALGDPEDPATRRVVEHVHRIGAEPTLLYRWGAAADDSPASLV